MTSREILWVCYHPYIDTNNKHNDFKIGYNAAVDNEDDLIVYWNDLGENGLNYWCISDECEVTY